MLDREKVLKGMEHCVTESDCRECVYFEQMKGRYDGYKCDCIADALAMMKKQEPKQIVRKQGKHENSDGSIDYFAEWYCPHCGKLLNRGFDLPWIEFCHKCGGAVKWNG